MRVLAAPPPLARPGDSSPRRAGRCRPPPRCARARRAEGVGVHGQRLAQLALGEHLDRDVLARAQAVGLHQLDRDLGAGVEAALQRGDVHRLGVRAERLEGHRLLHVRPAQLAHPHVDRHLAALEARPALGARARAGALLAAAGGLARARALAAADALARAAAAGRRMQVVQADALPARCLRRGAHLPSSTSTRWRTACSMPRACSESLTWTVWPMRRRPSERSVSSCFLFAPLRERRWVTFSGGHQAGAVSVARGAAGLRGLAGAVARRRRSSSPRRPPQPAPRRRRWPARCSGRAPG